LRELESRAPGGSTITERGEWLRPTLPVAACVLLVSAMAHVRVPLLPFVGDELSMPESRLGLAVTLFGLGRLAMDLPAGSLADRFRPMQLMAVSALVMATGSAGLAGATQPVMVMAAFLVLGAASATANTTGMTTMSGAAPPHRRGYAMALYSGCLLAGQALGPAVSGIVADLEGWRVAAGTGAGMGVLVAVLAFSWAPRQPGSRGPVERHQDAVGVPLTRVQRNVAYGVGFGVFLTVAAMPQTLLPLIGAGELGLRVSTIGLAIGLGGLARVVGALVTGAVSDGISRRAALLPCLVLQLGGVAILAVDGGTTWWLVSIILMSLGASAHAVAATVLADSVNPAELGRSLGRYRFAADTGLVAGPVLAATVYETLGRTAAVASITGVLLAVTVAAAALLPETRPRATRGGR
jgi:MFS transporter, DHA1 family, multidrug resistance protein